jgi:hypothetical protein
MLIGSGLSLPQHDLMCLAEILPSSSPPPFSLEHAISFSTPHTTIDASPYTYMCVSHLQGTPVSKETSLLIGSQLVKLLGPGIAILNCAIVAIIGTETNNGIEIWSQAFRSLLIKFDSS